MLTRLEGKVISITFDPTGFSLTFNQKLEEIPSLNMTIEKDDKNIETVRLPFRGNSFVSKLVANALDGEKVKYFGDEGARMYVLWVKSGALEGTEYSYQAPSKGKFSKHK